MSKSPSTTTTRQGMALRLERLALALRDPAGLNFAMLIPHRFSTEAQAANSLSV